MLAPREVEGECKVAYMRASSAFICTLLRFLRENFKDQLLPFFRFSAPRRDILFAFAF